MCQGRNSGKDVAVLRLLDKHKSRAKMLTIRFSPKEGKVSHFDFAEVHEMIYTTSVLRKKYKSDFFRLLHYSLTLEYFLKKWLISPNCSGRAKNENLPITGQWLQF